MRIIFFGTPSFALPSLEALFNSEEVVAVVTQPDRRKGRDRVPSPPPVKELATKRGIKVLQPESIRDPLFYKELTLLRPDIIIVVAYGRILPKRILELPPYDCINVHASLLPKYRGAAPVQWAIINGEKKTGVTIMRMDEGLDTGDILLQEETVIYHEDNSETLGQRLAEMGGRLLIMTLQKMKDGTLNRIPQTGTPSYAPPLEKEDGRILWSNTAIELFNFIRGMYPWPCAYCYLKKERIKIIRVNALEGTGEPGRIEKAGEELIIGTGRGLISIIELQPEGRRVMTAKEFIPGKRLKEGAFFNGQ